MPILIKCRFSELSIKRRGERERGRACIWSFLCMQKVVVVERSHIVHYQSIAISLFSV